MSVILPKIIKRHRKKNLQKKEIHINLTLMHNGFGKIFLMRWIC